MHNMSHYYTSISNTSQTQSLHMHSPQVQAKDTELRNNLSLSDGSINEHPAELGG